VQDKCSRTSEHFHIFAEWLSPEFLAEWLSPELLAEWLSPELLAEWLSPGYPVVQLSPELPLTDLPEVWPSRGPVQPKQWQGLLVNAPSLMLGHKTLRLKFRK
jgi:hypothetical protein